LRLSSLCTACCSQSLYSCWPTIASYSSTGMAQRPRPTKFMTTTRTCAHTHARARAHSHARARLHWARAHAHVHALHRTIQAVQERASQRHHDIHVTRPHLFKRSTHGEIQERLFPPHPPLTGTSNLKPQTSNLKPQTSNLKPQTSNLKPQTSNLKPQTSNLNLKPQTALRPI